MADPNNIPTKKRGVPNGSAQAMEGSITETHEKQQVVELDPSAKAFILDAFNTSDSYSARGDNRGG
jgi:hypothetical protein